MDKQLLKKYLEGDCSEVERKEVEKYLMEEKEDMEPFREMLEQAWDKETAGAQAPGDQALKTELQDELHQRLFATADDKSARVVSLRRRWHYGVAAAVASIVIMGAFLWKQAVRNRGNAEERPTIAWKTLINNGREQRTAVLPDNTRIWLNPGSQISYPAGLVDQQRVIKLQGEAFFDVAQDPSHPFIVQTSHLITKVLGTSFNIEAYPTEENVRVALVSGRVAVRTDTAAATQGHEVPLEAGQLFTYNTRRGESRTRILRLKNNSDWTNGQIVLADVPLKDALDRLAVRLHLNLIYPKGDEWKNKRVSSVFTKETPDEILHLLLFAADGHFRRKGDSIEIILQ
jgi:transmembrane sensor